MEMNMSKNDFIQQLLRVMGRDAFGQSRVCKIDQSRWVQVCKAEISRLSGLSYSELETLYHNSEGLYEMAD